MRVSGNRRGSDITTSKLDEHTVRDIRNRLADGECGQSIAVEFDISPQQVSNIKHRRSWAWVE